MHFALVLNQVLHAISDLNHVDLVFPQLDVRGYDEDRSDAARAGHVGHPAQRQHVAEQATRIPQQVQGQEQGHNLVEPHSTFQNSVSHYGVILVVLQLDWVDLDSGMG